MQHCASQEGLLPWGVHSGGPPTAAATRIGSTLDGKLTLVALLGEGGMGAVYRARQHSMDREVAVKLLRSERATDPGSSKRFLQEARSASRLGHPHIVSVFDFGETAEGELYLVMELISGRTLRDLLDATGPLPPRRALALAGQIADALAAAHEAGVIHRDLKPENVLLVSGPRDLVKVVDFGVAKLVDGAGTGITQAGSVCGTPAYMSPEQALGEAVDGRSDVYALGVLMYEMLAGVHPYFDVDQPLQMMLAHVNRTPTPIADLRPGLGVPRSVEALVGKAAAKATSDRFQGAGALREAIDACLVGLPADVVAGGAETDAAYPAAPAATVAAAAIPPAAAAVPTTTGTSDVATLAGKASPWPWIGGALVVAVLAAALWWRYGDVEPKPTAHSSAAAEIPTTPSPPRGEPPHTTSPPPTVAPRPAALPPAVTAVDPPAPAPAPSVEIAVAPDPTGAVVVVGDTVVGTGATRVRRPAAGSPMEVEVRMRGYVTERVILTAESPAEVVVKLAKARRPASGPVIRQ